GRRGASRSGPTPTASPSRRSRRCSTASATTTCSHSVFSARRRWTSATHAAAASPRPTGRRSSNSFSPPTGISSGRHRDARKSDKSGRGGLRSVEKDGPMSEQELPARESMDFDVVIVGAGPAGLAAAIRLKQLSSDISVVVVEKGSEVGAHILSGAVVDPSGLDALLPNWRREDTPVKTAVADDRFYMLGPAGALRLP